jgi:hypothetical protein
MVAVFVIAAGLYVATSLSIVWAACNHWRYVKRAFATGLIRLVGNSSGAAIVFIFKAETAPRDAQGMHVIIVLIALSIAFPGSTAVLLDAVNKSKRCSIAGGAPDQAGLGDRTPYFLYYFVEGG